MNILKKLGTKVLVSPGTPPVPPQPGSGAWDEVIVQQTRVLKSAVIIDQYGVSITVTWWETVETRTVIHHAAIPGTPGSPGTPATYITDANPGWTAGAISVGSLAGDGAYQFVAPKSDIGLVSGLNSANEGAGYLEIDYGIYAHSGQAQIVEQGVLQGADFAYADGDVFTVSRAGTTVKYYLNSTLLYTSATPSYGKVFADVSLYYADDQIVDAKFASAVGFGGNVAEGSGAVELNGFGATDVDVVGYGSFTLNGAGSGGRIGGSGSLSLSGYGFTDKVSGLGYLRLSGYGEKLLAPPFNVGTGNLWLATYGSCNYNLAWHSASIEVNGLGVVLPPVSSVVGLGKIPLNGYGTTRSQNNGRGSLTLQTYALAGFGDTYAAGIGSLELTGYGEPERTTRGSGVFALEGFGYAPSTAYAYGYGKFTFNGLGFDRIPYGFLVGCLSGYQVSVKGHLWGLYGQHGGNYEVLAFGMKGNPSLYNAVNYKLSGYSFVGKAGGVLKKSLPKVTVSVKGATVILGRFDQTLSGYALETRAGAALKADLPVGTLDVTGTVILLGRMRQTLSGYAFSATGGARLDAMLPAGVVTTAGTVVTLGRLSAKLPKLSGSGVGGGVGKMSLPRASVSIAASTVLLGRLNATLPAGQVAVSATASQLARGVVKHGGGYVVAAGGGGVLKSALSTLQATLQATVSLKAKLDAALPRLTLEGSGTTGILARLNVSLPKLGVTPVGMLRVTLPRLTLQATGSLTVAVEYEGYAFTLVPTETGLSAAASHYTTFPFDRIVRWKGRHFGVGADGLYELTGDTFDGEPIVATVQTAETDFGHQGFKRIPSLYLSGRVGADMDISLITGESREDEYTGYRPVVKTGADMHRVVFGKGVRAHYAAFKFTNPEGEDFALDGMNPLVDALKRSV